MQSLKSIENSNMPKLTKIAIRHGRMDVRTDPNYGKASLLKIKTKRGGGEDYQEQNTLNKHLPIRYLKVDGMLVYSVLML